MPTVVRLAQPHPLRRIRTAARTGGIAIRVDGGGTAGIVVIEDSGEIGGKTGAMTGIVVVLLHRKQTWLRAVRFAQDGPFEMLKRFRNMLRLPK
jgi:hypothetical protein